MWERPAWALCCVPNWKVNQGSFSTPLPPTGYSPFAGGELKNNHPVSPPYQGGVAGKARRGGFIISTSMTRSDLIEAFADRFPQLQRNQAEVAVRIMLDAMNGALVTGQRIEIRGFGSFSVTYRAPRMGRNPRSGERVAIPEKRTPHFKPGKALRNSVNALPLQP